MNFTDLKMARRAELNASIETWKNPILSAPLNFDPVVEGREAFEHTVKINFKAVSRF